MNEMKAEFSPAAQAVLDASGTTGTFLELATRGIAAAALRAAADHLDAESPWPGHIESTGVNWSRNELHKLATKLEAQA
jgi:hypothetical protein